MTMSFIVEAHDALAYFASVYRRAGYFGRLRVWVRIENADNAMLVPERDMALSASRRLFTPEESLSYTEDTSVERLLDNPMRLVHAAMDFVWQAYGFERCLHFSDAGELLGI
jgi:hypothetical protein